MSVNDFSTEDSVRAAYDAAARCLLHALDTEVIFTNEKQAEQRQTVERLAVRIVDAVMHSSETDIDELLPGVVERVGESNGSGHFVSEPARMSTA